MWALFVHCSSIENVHIYILRKSRCLIGSEYLWWCLLLYMKPILKFRPDLIAVESGLNLLCLQFPKIFLITPRPKHWSTIIDIAISISQPQFVKIWWNWLRIEHVQMWELFMRQLQWLGYGHRGFYIFIIQACISTLKSIRVIILKCLKLSGHYP